MICQEKIKEAANMNQTTAIIVVIALALVAIDHFALRIRVGRMQKKLDKL